ncbi:hypothetical protein BRADI_4g31373v3 [Brachypodium distachyon]|uniref:Uncharacterized protein n=1 Tax=Brachypodium distachyon TaxID=15368 RepID=A0A0Q3EVR8_BRADI|nr:hypothetical protein BRADI_4g31373v3 [Brachypodium distachyon]
MALQPFVSLRRERRWGVETGKCRPGEVGDRPGGRLVPVPKIPVLAVSLVPPAAGRCSSSIPRVSTTRPAPPRRRSIPRRANRPPLARSRPAAARSRAGLSGISASPPPAPPRCSPSSPASPSPSPSAPRGRLPRSHRLPLRAAPDAAAPFGFSFNVDADTYQLRSGLPASAPVLLIGLLRRDMVQREREIRSAAAPRRPALPGHTTPYAAPRQRATILSLPYTGARAAPHPPRLAALVALRPPSLAAGGSHDWDREAR